VLVGRTLWLFNKRHLWFRAQYFAKVSVKLRHGWLSFDSSKQPLPEENLSRRETVPNDILFRGRTVAGLSRLIVGHAATADPEHKWITATHQAPAPVLIDDILDAIAFLFQALL
jgi:hypothetical protein